MKRILIAVTDQELRTHVRQEWAEHCELLEANSGAEAVYLAATTQPDLVLVSIILDDVCGVEVIKASRHHNPGARVVALARHGDIPATAYAEMARAIGAHEALVEPVRMPQLQRHLLMGVAQHPSVATA
jgi:DNA-binding NtrC family response regulator